METQTNDIDQLTNAALYEQWKLWKERNAYARNVESRLRTALVQRFFPEPKEGSSNVTVDAGVTVKLTVKQPVDRKVDAAILDNLKKAPEMAGVSFDKVIREKPELALREYKALDAETRGFFDQCLTIKFGSPQLEAKEL